jgi:hypothetical protein
MPQHDYLIPIMVPVSISLLAWAIWWVVQDFEKMSKKDKDKISF